MPLHSDLLKALQSKSADSLTTDLNYAMSAVFPELTDSLELVESRFRSSDISNSSVIPVTLDSSDTNNVNGIGRYSKNYNSSFDNYGQLVNADIKATVSENHDFHGLNAQISFSEASNISYALRARSYGSGDTGNYAVNTTQGNPTAATSITASVGFNSSYGYGLVNAAAAVASAIGQTPFPDAADRGSNDWATDIVKAPEVWAQGLSGQGIVVAVVDSGVDYNHADLNTNIWTNSREIPGNVIDDDANGFVDDIRGWDFVERDSDPMDLNKHGTHVAGIIAAKDNGAGITGVAYNARIMPVRALDASGRGSDVSIAAGIRYATNNGANVINLSLAGEYSPMIEEAVRYATERGAVVVTAAGNEGEAQPSYPARLSGSFGMAVGAVDRNNHIAGFSNRAGNIALDYVVAPGASIVSTTPNNAYQSLSGTSMAAPHVAGVVALMLSANRNLTPAQLESILTATANPTGVGV
jgi:subtilisin family serine protease